MIYDWCGLEYAKRTGNKALVEKNQWLARLAQRCPEGVGRLRQLLG